MTKEELIKNQFPNDEFLQSGVLQIVDKCTAELEKENAELKHQLAHRNCLDCSNHSSNLRMRNLDLEKENAELKGIKDVATLIRANNDTVTTLMQLNNMLVSRNQQLTKAKELLEKWVELFKPKGGNIPPTPIQVDTEQFLSEV